LEKSSPRPSDKEEGLLLKLSGEVFLQPRLCEAVVREIAALAGRRRFAVLVGGGNHIRGAQTDTEGTARILADRMGMVGTLLNGMQLEAMLVALDARVLHMSAVLSTDTSAVLRAVEIGARRVLKGTKVKGVYSADPNVEPNAEFFPELSYADALARNLAVMDQTAFSLAREHDLIIQVFDVFGHPENIGRIARGERVGTVVKRGAEK